MTRIPSEDRDLMEKAIYFPMLVKVLEKDLYIINNSPFKLRNPYLMLIDNTLTGIQSELFLVKKIMKKRGMKVQEVKRDDTFTTYLFIYNGYEEYHNYFNPRLKNKVEELLSYYLFKRFENNQSSDQSLRVTR
ncbi:hypothetical protein OEV98_02760 [Caldibacillus lycopersici]|uniref:YhjD n=1 Tax=Perspicuibacillus lycopersici TaxID=1325689 RepID=A0AAE3IS88_9BACI|nr:hypothetical protein [Perspicuibacillus lycopersici]MCU9612484.1 hypothetical protein [Perspicuibacillus lycopersici]